MDPTSIILELTLLYSTPLWTATNEAGKCVFMCVFTVLRLCARVCVCVCVCMCLGWEVW